jgi:type I restriction enzyme S subunit
MREGWEIKKWSEVLEIRSGRNQKEVLNPDGLYPILGSAGKVMGYADKYLCEAGTTIIGRKGNINSPLFIKEKFWNVDTAFGLHATDILDKNYLHYFCLSFDFSEMDRGSGRPSLVKSDLLKIEIPIPPIPEQKQIVALLDQAFTAIDQAKANIEKNIANAKELFQSKLNEIFSQKGDGWEEKTLGEVCENLDRKRVPITKSKRVHGEIPYYGASGIVDYVVDYLFDEDLLLVSEDGANLLARTYPIAFSISGKNWVNNHAHVLKFENMTSQIFIEYYLNSIKLDEYISGMAQPKLNQKKLNSIKIPFPILDEQERTIKLLKSFSEKKSSITKFYEVKLKNLDELKKSILQKAFAGELTQTKVTA